MYKEILPYFIFHFNINKISKTTTKYFIPFFLFLDINNETGLILTLTSS